MGFVLLGAGIMFVGVLFGAVITAAVIGSDKQQTQPQQAPLWSSREGSK